MTTEKLAAAVLLVVLAVALAVVRAKLARARRVPAEILQELADERAQVAVLADEAEVNLRVAERMADRVVDVNGENAALAESLAGAKAALGHKAKGDDWEAGAAS